jgi:1-acyl-sn-glycerol-3-phosphate acyltransferase
VLRSAFAVVATIVLTLVFGLPALVLSLVNRRGDWVLRLGRPWARGICAASGVTVDSVGTENVPADRPVILISNHQSHFDMLAILLTMPRPFRVVAKRHLFYIPVFGWCLSLAGMIPIDRENRAAAIQSLERAAERIRGGEPVLFFPEGTRSHDGGLLPFKKGAFVIAMKAGAPIVPVSVA